ncbi:hypothetical protein [Streptomyces sp. HF10]|nr:hypothetical protein [Streptomyces sp. HF10]QHC33138.1 hypothetical protein GR129_34680 [Streptomyces sp. HF10]
MPLAAAARAALTLLLALPPALAVHAAVTFARLDRGPSTARSGRPGPG